MAKSTKKGSTAPVRRNAGKAEVSAADKSVASASGNSDGHDARPERTGVPDDGVSEHEVAKRAYEIYMARGAAHGRDMEDWLEAERALRRRAS